MNKPSNHVRPKTIAFNLLDQIEDEKGLWLIVTFLQGLITNEDKAKAAQADSQGGEP